MATRNRTPVYRKYRDALRSVRLPAVSPPPAHAGPSSSSAGGPMIELVSTSLLHTNRAYTPLSTEDRSKSSKGPLAVGLPPAWVDVLKKYRQTYNVLGQKCRS